MSNSASTVLTTASGLTSANTVCVLVQLLLSAVLRCALQLVQHHTRITALVKEK
jgi:hypothetical protein